MSFASPPAACEERYQTELAKGRPKVRMVHKTVENSTRRLSSIKLSLIRKLLGPTGSDVSRGYVDQQGTRTSDS
jgi:hypothetical protein